MFVFLIAIIREEISKKVEIFKGEITVGRASTDGLSLRRCPDTKQAAIGGSNGAKLTNGFAPAELGKIKKEFLND